MTVYQPSGDPITLNGTGSVQEDYLYVEYCHNQFTGAVGTNFVKVYNESANGAAVITFTPTNQTYTFTGLTGTASVSGANAVFTVTVGNSAYTATVTSAGDGYIATETVTILGTDVGGDATPANDVVITVDDVDGNGAITGISVAGTVTFPQGIQPNIYVPPGQTEYVQVYSLPVDILVRGNVVDGNIIVSPIQIVG